MRVAVIGTSGYSYAILNEIWMRPDLFLLVAVSTMDAADPRARECAARGARVFSSVDELLEHCAGGCDLVYNPSPIHCHRRLTEQCLRAGLDVVVEKPPFATVQDQREVTALAASVGRRVGVGFNHLHAPGLRRLQRELQAGHYGAVLGISGLGAWRRNDAYYRRSDWAGRVRVGDDWVLDGSLGNPLAHLLANQLFLAAPAPGALADVKWVEAAMYRAHRIETEDICGLRVETPEGVEVALLTSLCADQSDTSTTVVRCAEASIEIRDFETIMVRRSGAPVETRTPAVAARAQMLVDLHAAWKDGRPFPVNVENTLAFTRVLNLAWESAAPVVSVPEPEIVPATGEGGEWTAVRGLDDAMRRAHEQRRSLHDTGLGWTHAPRRVSADGYARFPSINATLQEWLESAEAQGRV